MTYEMRTYHCKPEHIGRLTARFEHDVLPLWEEYGIRLVGFWQTAVGPLMDVMYILAWDSLAERESLWSAYQADERWLEIKQQSEAETGPWVYGIESTLLAPTQFSPLP